ncbi:MAG: sulfate adenylyltransferase subunit CysN, partial [Kiritimatiellae bacterium]|nr:sulfate adenylyltransferase subunit CysN [Kiritimatiellia bacterium]
MAESVPGSVADYLEQHEKKDLLRILTCGSVDDGKSTLIGRILYDTKLIYEDQLAAVNRDSKLYGTTGTDFDPALLTDGLKAEREQGITIDVAYRYFSTNRRKFIIADCPGHEQYTRNMATGASTCNLAIILIDARKGVLTQTRRHSFICSLLGIRHVVVAVNKMDLVNWSEDIFRNIQKEYMEFVERMNFSDIHFIPLSALKGDYVVDHSEAMPWYTGPALLEHLEQVNLSSDRNLVDFRFPVQTVIRPHLDFRGFAGTVASGVVRKGDEVLALPSRRKSRVKSIVTWDGERDEAYPPLAVTLTLEDEIDLSRGDMLVHPNNVPRFADAFEAMVVWMHEDSSKPGRSFWIKQTSNMIPGTLETIRYKIDVNTMRKQEGGDADLHLNEIGRVHISLHRPLAFDPYDKNRQTGSFILIDRATNATVAAGMIVDRLTLDRYGRPATEGSKSRNIRYEDSFVTREDRERLLGQKACTIWLTGLSGSG